jgi:alpha,alpha-trehalase
MSDQTGKYTACLKYINDYWSKATFYHPRDKGKHLGLPQKFVAPNSDIFKNDQFYWDSYFIICGLVKNGRVKLARGMVDNFVYLLERFNIIPMRNRYYNLGTSQIPFLTSMAFEVFDSQEDKVWLKKVIQAAEKELKVYWMNEKLTETHITYKGLSRYCDHYITHLGAEHESGWDMT